jgi:diguanylate cyclase (GGDEF)-like protein
LPIHGPIDGKRFELSGWLEWLLVGFVAWVLGSVLTAVLVIKVHGWVIDAGERLIRPNGYHSAAGIAELLAAELNDRVHAEFAAVYLLAPNGDLELVGAAGPVSEALPRVPALVQRAVRSRRFSTASPQELAELDALETDVSAAFATPLLVGRTARGALFAGAGPAGWDEPVPAGVAAFASMAVAVLGLAEYAAVQEEEARNDVLTKLPNRRAFEEEVDVVLATRKMHEEVGLAVLDLDGFKSVNDEGGHALGDEVLRRTARALLDEVRSGEAIFRVGGDEFALMVRDGAKAAATAVARIRSALRRVHVPRTLPTFSAGISAAPTDGTSREELIRRADAALYAAKLAGRDRSVIYQEAPPFEEDAARRVALGATPYSAVRVLVVDDDAGLRTLLRHTLSLDQIVVAEADSAAAATLQLRTFAPNVIVLDVGMPQVDGLTFCAQLKREPRTRAIPVVLLSGLGAEAQARAREVGAEAFLHKPFSPLELLGLIKGLASAAGVEEIVQPAATKEQLLAYAVDLRSLVESGLRQQSLLRSAYRQTVNALANALESKDAATRSHSDRVVSYASELTLDCAPALLDDPSLEYGFLLHDVGKIGIPDGILQKPGPLDPAERRAMERHTIVGADMLHDVPLLAGEGIRIVRSHHERWDGAGYPDRLAGDEIPLGARIFAVADTLDALTSDRPYRSARDWDTAAQTIVRESGRQFDPAVVNAFRDVEGRLRDTFTEFALARDRDSTSS